MGAIVPGADLAVPPVMFPGAPEIVGAGHENVVPLTSGVVVSGRFAEVLLQID